MRAVRIQPPDVPGLCTWDMVGAHGLVCHPRPRPKGIRKAKIGNCFGNAWHLVYRAPEDLVYTEGYAFSVGDWAWLRHAWCVDRKLNVIDPTWNAESSLYIGIPFSVQFLSAACLSLGHMGPYCEDIAADGSVVAVSKAGRVVPVEVSGGPVLINEAVHPWFRKDWTSLGKQGRQLALDRLIESVALQEFKCSSTDTRECERREALEL